MSMIDTRKSDCAENVYVVRRMDNSAFKDKLHKLTTSDLVACISNMDELEEEFSLNRVSINIEASRQKYNSFAELDRIFFCDGLFARVVCEVNDGNLSYTIVFNCDRLVFPEDCSSLFMKVRAGSMKFSGCDFSAVVDAELMFYAVCLNSLYLRDLNTVNLTYACFMFRESYICNLCIEGMRMDSLDSAMGMFYDCEIPYIDLSKVINMNKLSSISFMFYGTKAQSINTGNLGGALVLFSDKPFYGCKANIIGGRLIKFKAFLAGV